MDTTRGGSQGANFEGDINEKLHSQAMKIANIGYLIDQAPQFIKALDQAPTSAVACCLGWVHVPP